MAGPAESVALVGSETRHSVLDGVDKSAVLRELENILGSPSFRAAAAVNSSSPTSSCISSMDTTSCSRNAVLELTYSAGHLIMQPATTP
jgi:hypothetical protein